MTSTLKHPVCTMDTLRSFEVLKTKLIIPLFPKCGVICHNGFFNIEIKKKKQKKNARVKSTRYFCI